MVHSFYEIYGSLKAGELLTSLARVLAVHLQFHGFTCSIEDLCISSDTAKERRNILEDWHQKGVKAAAQFVGLDDFEPKRLNYTNRVVYQSEEKKSKKIQQYTDLAIVPDGDACRYKKGVD